MNITAHLRFNKNNNLLINRKHGDICLLMYTKLQVSSDRLVSTKLCYCRIKNENLFIKFDDMTRFL